MVSTGWRTRVDRGYANLDTVVVFYALMYRRRLWSDQSELGVKVDISEVKMDGFDWEGVRLQLSFDEWLIGFLDEQFVAIVDAVLDE